MLPGPHEPFLLIDDARTSGARLYTGARELVRADRLEDVLPALERLRAAHRAGLHVAGYLAYEAGLAFEPRLARLMPDSPEGPLLWFGLFDAYQALDNDAVRRLFANCGAGRTGPLAPRIDRAGYDAAFATVQENIRAGDIYQANLTFACEVPVSGDMAGLYARLRASSRAGHGALVRADDHMLLSLSPELFFTLAGDRLTARPMKGTALRDADPDRDAENADELRADAKQRAENLMIVDLLRNDLSRVAQAGSVKVPRLFEVESYPTVHQMTSTVTASLSPGLDVFDVIVALFPCGSITGAPKMRAMEIIHAVERRWRGAYTGSIGYIDPPGGEGRGAQFNVAIRTICVKDGADRGVLGLGSGLVADSVARAEWIECLDKGRFLGGGAPPAEGDA